MWYNALIRFILLTPLHGLISSGILLINYTGRKSGKHYSVPVSYTKDNGDFLILSLRKRTWWRSLIGGAPVTIRHRGRNIPASAKAITEIEPVIQDLAIYLEKEPSIAKGLGIEIDGDGHPDLEQVRQEAEKRVIVRVQPE